MRRRAFSLGAVLLLSGLAAASKAVPDSKPQAAQALLNAALKKAKAEHKPVFVLFDASW